MYDININWLLTGKGEMHLEEPTSPSGVGGNNNIAIGSNSTVNGSFNINTSDFNHSNDIKEIVELLQFAPSGFLTIIKEKLQAFKKMSHF
jgi:hypothetical protein